MLKKLIFRTRIGKAISEPELEEEKRQMDADESLENRQMEADESSDGLTQSYKNVWITRMKEALKRKGYMSRKTNNWSAHTLGSN